MFAACWGDPLGCDFPAGEGVDPLTYVLRIAGVMIMVFGIAIGGMLTLFHLA
ncbi:hypothetical protein [Sphingobium chungbukense]|uniref:hypothetical protein n=1 Tax=Sphingobium chungbukense TaxID=56193 RepID=UPI000AAD6F36|nr:hypothetical protein [Sphingobium chungbukense]